MCRPLVIAGLITVLIGQHAWATSWGLNSFADSVYWSDAIVIGKVKKVVTRAKNRVDIAIAVLENLKGSLSGEVQVREVDLGDATLNISPFPPLPANLIGKELLLFLKRGVGAFEAQNRGVVDTGSAAAMAFHDLRGASLRDIRAMVVELQLIQGVCPLERTAVANEMAALAACHLGLHSKHSQVQWYAARRLLDLPVQNHLLDDLAALATKQQSTYPVRYLLVQCIAKTDDQKAVPPLIDILRKDPADNYTLQALQRLTGKQLRTLAEWEHWWKASNERTVAGDGLREHAQQQPAATEASTVGVLLEGLKTRDVNVNDLAIKALAQAGDQVVPTLVQMLSKEDHHTRVQAVRALGKMGPKARAAVPALIESAKLRNVELRWQVVMTLASIGPEAKLAVPVLTQGLRDPFAGIRASSANALAAIGANDGAIIAALEKASTDADASVRKAAAAALARIKQK